MQVRAAKAIAVLIENCQDPTTPLANNPTAKIINNLASLLCQDPIRAPAFRDLRDVSGIYVLEEERQALESKKVAKSSSQVAGVTFDDTDDGARASDGAARALQALSLRFGDGIFDTLPRLMEITSTALSKERDFSEIFMHNRVMHLCSCTLPFNRRVFGSRRSGHNRLFRRFASFVAIPLCRSLESHFSIVPVDFKHTTLPVCDTTQPCGQDVCNRMRSHADLWYAVYH